MRIHTHARIGPAWLPAAIALALVAPLQAQDAKPVAKAPPETEAPAAAPTTAPALAAQDAVLAAASRHAARSVVLIEVERPDYGPRPLSSGERAGFGVRGYYDPRYFSRPEGPVTGVVVGAGLVATSQWNLEGDHPVRVVSSEGRAYSARRVGRDENAAVALLAVDAPGPDLVPIEPAEGAPRVGQVLLLIGRTKENAPLVTRGVVAGLGRQRGDAFTHSARTNFANVGGALIDLEGRLLGIAVRHRGRAAQGQSSGVAFGAPWQRFADNVPAMARGEVIAARPTAFLGIGIDPSYTGQGVRVREVIKGTGAEAAGVRAGDVVRIFNSVEIKHFVQLVEEIQKLEVGTEIVVTLRRDEEELDLRVQLGERPRED